jgi:predicted phosphoribosyltransferase
MNTHFADRKEAGRALAPRLRKHAGNPNAIVLAIPRGGVPVALEVARKLRLPLDTIVARRLSLTDTSMLALGAVAPGGIIVRHEPVLASLQLPEAEFQRIVAREQETLEWREQLYRGNRMVPNLEGLMVIIVDDGLQSGSTLRAAIRSVRLHRPASVVVAVPVASITAAAALRDEADEVISVLTPPVVYAIGSYYRDFRPVDDREIKSLLAQSNGNETRAAM